jgi:metallo-beta-lactamase family protein
MLPDSGYIQEMEVRQLNRRNLRHGKPEVTPIYTRQDAEDSLSRIHAVDYERWVRVGPGVRARFWNAGHILGSASIELEIDAKDGHALRLLFSGDLGPDNKLFHPDPDAPASFDYVVSEATYGGRERADTTAKARRSALAAEVTQALKHGGPLLVPVFAVERTQELITDLLALQATGKIPPVPIFLDSPLAIRVTEVFQKHAGDLEDLSADAQLLNSPMIYPTETVDESKRIARITGAAIIMAASGMCDAGRIRHHFKQWLWQSTATVLFVGYQAVGTLGRILSDGAKNVKIHGEEIRVRAAIRKLDAYSGHADGTELADWITERQPIRQKLFLTHGEETQMTALKAALVARGFDAKSILLPQLDDEMVLSRTDSALLIPARVQRIPADTIGQPDWHNDLTELVFDMREAFEKASDDKARARFVRRIRRALQADDQGN